MIKKTPSKVGIKRNSLNLIKDSYTNPTLHLGVKDEFFH